MKTIEEIEAWRDREIERTNKKYKQHMEKIDNWEKKITAAFADPKITGDEIVAMVKEACADMNKW